ncbi:cAMP-responsive element modulator-like [Terrapene carolina triunguis]|uniref:cAMP-responsive element modulator-like n=1 Tax=Terrapene triunguis TaxID=2587831 RepID=UPI000CEF865E|nr:cAMP-responsive element modulator-like [Terrapene carolina triunguis]
MTTEMVESQQDGSATDSVAESDAVCIQNQPGQSQIPPIAQVTSVANAEDSADSEGVIDSQKRREILSRRPSYRKILNELSSDATGVPKIEEEKSEEEGTPSGIPAMAVPTSLYQTSTGQYSTYAKIQYSILMLKILLLSFAEFKNSRVKNGESYLDQEKENEIYLHICPRGLQIASSATSH